MFLTSNRFLFSPPLGQKLSSKNSITTTTTTSRADSINVTYEFEAGRIYTVFPSVDTAKNSVTIGIEETLFPVQFGGRMGSYLGWQRNLEGNPVGGLYILAQLGLMAPAGDNTMEFLAEANASLFGYAPFDEQRFSIPPANIQAGGTANFYFGKSLEKTGFGLGGGVSLAANDSDNGADTIPYIRASFFFPSDSWHIRLFVDYSPVQEDELWRRFGLGLIFFLN